MVLRPTMAGAGEAPLRRPRPINVSTPAGQTSTIQPPAHSRVPAGRTLAPPIPVRPPGTSTAASTASAAVTPRPGSFPGAEAAVAAMHPTSIGGTTMVAGPMRTLTPSRATAAAPAITPADPEAGFFRVGERGGRMPPLRATDDAPPGPGSRIAAGDANRFASLLDQVRERGPTDIEGQTPKAPPAEGPLTPPPEPPPAEPPSEEWLRILEQLGGAPAGGDVNAVTGEERPFTVLPGRSEQLQGIIDQMQGLIGETIENPDPFSGELFEGLVDEAERTLNRRFDRAANDLSAILAERGMDFSTIAGTEFAELVGDRERAFQDFLRPLLRERALTAAENRRAALSGAGNLAAFLAALEGGERSELRGERGFLEGLRGQARDQAIQELLLGEQFAGTRESEMLNALAQALGIGFQAPNLLGSAGVLGSGAANAAAGQAGTNALIAQLASLLVQQFGRSGAATARDGTALSDPIFGSFG